MQFQSNQTISEHVENVLVVVKNRQSTTILQSINKSHLFKIFKSEFHVLPKILHKQCFKLIKNIT